MAKIQTKFIADDAINESKVKLSNDAFLRGRNNANSADVDMIKVNASDQLELASKLRDPDNSAPSADEQLANKKYVDDQVATISIPSVFELQGNWDASTNTPSLANTDTGVADNLYYVNVAGSVDFGAGSKTFSVGDWVYNVNGAWEKADNNDDVLSVNGQTGTVVLDTADVSEDPAALYFTDARARTAAVVNSTAGNETDQAASVDAMKTYVASQVSTASFGNEVFTLAALDISNGYVDLAQTPVSGSVQVVPVGGPVQEEGVDYTLSTNRVTFAGDLAAELADGDKLMVQYSF